MLSKNRKSNDSFTLVYILLAFGFATCAGGCSKSNDGAAGPSLGSSSTSGEASVNTSATMEAPVEPEPDLKYPVPVGSATELANFLSNMAQREARGSTPDEATDDLAEISKSRRHAAEKLLKIPDADPVFHLMASEAKLESLRTLVLISQADPTEFAKFADELTTHEDAAISQVGRIGRLQSTLDEVRALGVVDTEALLSSIRGITEHVNRDEHPDLRVLYALSEAGQVLQQVDEVETAIETYNIGAELLSVPAGDTRSTLDITMRYIQELESVGQVDAARGLLETVRTKFAEHPDQDLKNDALAAVGMAEKRLGRIGQPLEIKGQTLNGDAFDVESVKGKVVLLQFWTTTGPFTESRLTDLQKLYRRYHDRGLEIVAVNLDDDDATVTAYLDAIECEWPTIRNKEFAQDLRIDAGLTPYSFLADVSGKIVQVNPTSDVLQNSVVELLAAVELPEVSTAAESTKGEDTDLEADALNHGESETSSGGDSGAAADSEPPGDSKKSDS